MVLLCSREEILPGFKQGDGSREKVVLVLLGKQQAACMAEQGSSLVLPEQPDCLIQCPGSSSSWHPQLQRYKKTSNCNGMLFISH